MPKHILVVLSADPPEMSAEMEAWSKEHIVHMVETPTFKNAQAFRFHQEHTFAFPETVPTRPPYQNLVIYEIPEEEVDAFLHPNLSDMAPPPQPPGGIGPNRPDGYLFVATTDVVGEA
ncbi:hypothetical protein [uncultured Amnibacterium sp.]|uniref:hypothetical protein n=1 Tax=uncultured Amnibacterium sp. TaxID=1631851 RepID=UPI0035CABADB